jgi:hypothetical protein
MPPGEIEALAKNISSHVFSTYAQLFARRGPTGVEPKTPTIYVVDRKVAPKQRSAISDFASRD